MIFYDCMSSFAHANIINLGLECLDGKLDASISWRICQLSGYSIIFMILIFQIFPFNMFSMSTCARLYHTLPLDSRPVTKLLIHGRPVSDASWLAGDHQTEPCLVFSIAQWLPSGNLSHGSYPQFNRNIGDLMLFHCQVPSASCQSIGSGNSTAQGQVRPPKSTSSGPDKKNMYANVAVKIPYKCTF